MEKFISRCVMLDLLGKVAYKEKAETKKELDPLRSSNRSVSPFWRKVKFLTEQTTFRQQTTVYKSSRHKYQIAALRAAINSVTDNQSSGASFGSSDMESKCLLIGYLVFNKLKQIMGVIQQPSKDKLYLKYGANYEVLR